MTLSRQATPWLWAAAWLSGAASLGAVAGAGLAGWHITQGRPLPQPTASPAENVLFVAIGLGFLCCALCALVVIPLAVVSHTRQTPASAPAPEVVPDAEAGSTTPGWLIVTIFVAVFGLLGMAGGALEPFFRRLSAPTENTLSLTLGMAAMGAGVGALWARLERVLSQRGGDWESAVRHARKRLARWTLIASLAMGALGMCVIGGPLLLFQLGMPLLGFQIPPLAAKDFARIAGMGLVVGGGWGVLAGLAAAFVATWRRPAG